MLMDIVDLCINKYIYLIINKVYISIKSCKFIIERILIL